MALTDYDFTKLIDKHESFKLKFGDLKIEDLFEWVKLKEEMVVMAINMDSELSEKKITLNNEKWKRMIELKLELWPDWRKKHTESTAQWVINLEFVEQDLALEKLKNAMKVLNERAKNIIEYVNLSKRYLDIDDDYQANMKWDLIE